MDKAEQDIRIIQTEVRVIYRSEDEADNADRGLNNSDTRLKTHRLVQIDIDRREQCCAANYEQVVNHVVPSCYS